MFNSFEYMCTIQLITCAGNWSRTITSDQIVHNNSSLSFQTCRSLDSYKFIIYFARVTYLILREYCNFRTKSSRRTCHSSARINKELKRTYLEKSRTQLRTWIWPGFQHHRPKTLNRSVNPWVPTLLSNPSSPFQVHRAFSRDGKHFGTRNETVPVPPCLSRPPLEKRGSIHPSVSLFHNKIVMRRPDWLGSLEGLHNAPWACPRQYPEGCTRQRGRKGAVSLPCLGGCRCVNRAHTKRHTPRAIVRAPLGLKGAPSVPQDKGLSQGRPF